MMTTVTPLKLTRTAPPNATLVALARSAVEALVDAPEEVAIGIQASGNGSVLLTMKVAPEETGKVIGAKGRNIEALRTLLTAIAYRHRLRLTLELVQER